VDAHAGTIGLLGAVWVGDPAPSLEKLERATALIAGTSSCLMALSREPRFVQGVWGPYYGAVLPNMWMNEGGQSAAGALIDYTLEHHRQYPALELKAERESISVYEAANRIVDQLDAGAAVPRFADAPVCMCCLTITATARRMPTRTREAWWTG
jgi:ribulose kinase